MPTYETKRERAYRKLHIQKPPPRYTGVTPPAPVISEASKEIVSEDSVEIKEVPREIKPAKEEKHSKPQTDVTEGEVTIKDTIKHKKKKYKKKQTEV